MGHAGAIVGGTDDTAEAKKQIMREWNTRSGFQLKLVKVKEVLG
jgi:succinyl-CoA synthetase alpha subunit